MNTPTDLYRHFDSNGTLLYVGISLSTLNRLGQHKDNSRWYNSISNITIEKFNTREEALLAEKNSIINERPYYNTIHNSGVNGVIKRMDKLSVSISNVKNPITYKDELNKRVSRWMDEYDSLARILQNGINYLQSDIWNEYCSNRGYNIGHCGDNFVR